MTRESKIGLLVAGSFLCLVCIVVASKWNRGETPGGSEEQTVQVAAVKPTQSNKSSDAKKESPPKKESAVVEPPKGPALSMPKEFGTGGTEGTPLPLPPQVLGKDTTPLPMPPEVKKDGASLPLPPDLTKEGSPLPLPPTLPKLGDAPLDKKDNGLPKPPPLLEEKKGIEIVQLEPKKNELPTGKDIPLPLAKDLPPLGKDLFPLPPPVGLVQKEDPKEPAKLVFPPPKKDETKTVANDFPPVTIGPINKTPVPDQSTITTTGGNKALPIVRDVSVNIAVAQLGETSMADISKRLYASDKYADALLAYNRKHASEVKNGTVFMAFQPNLSIGQEVLHPPVGVLERDFGPYIRTTPPSPLVGEGPGVRGSAPSITPPVKIGGPVGTPPSPLVGEGPGVRGGAATGRTYRVDNPTGESFLDVAERALGDSRQWHRIWRVNAQYQPQFRVPAGTVLQLPGN